MVCNLSSHEIRMLYKIVYKRRWCDKHISKEDLASGTPIHERGLFMAAIDSLITKQWLVPYKSQGREDVCINKQNMQRAKDTLTNHESEYTFIRGLQFIR